MNFINALSWPQWLVLLAIPPAVLSLYFLKLKRKTVEVPSTLLWKKSLEDLYVNSLWQRLRNSLLLFMQLLFLGLLILACLRPGWSGTERVGEKRIYMLDHSASMQTSDAQPNRLEEAKLGLRSLIENSGNDDVGMLIAFSDRVDVRQGFTKDKNKLLAALESVSATNRTTNFAEAIRTAAALAIPPKEVEAPEESEDAESSAGSLSLPATVYLFSDGGFETIDEPSADRLSINFFSSGDSSTSNVGILSFAVQRKEGAPDQMEAFARLASYGGTEVSFTASLEIDGELVDATRIKMAPDTETGIVFEISSLSEGNLKLSLDVADSNPIDNVAYAAVRPPRRIKVLLVTPGNSALEAAMSTDRCRQISETEVRAPGYLNEAEYQAREKQGEFELIVFDRCTPKAMPLASTLFIGIAPPSAEEWTIGEASSPVLILDVDRSHPITQFLEMGSIIIVEGMTVKPPEGGKVLMTSDSGPALGLVQRGPFQDAVLGFSVAVNENTDWGLRRSFPVFVYAAIESLGGGEAESSATSIRPGEPMRIGLAPQIVECVVETPGGDKWPLVRSSDSRFLFTRTDELGIYKVYAKDSGELLETFCVNLFSSRESDVRAVNTIELGSNAVAADSSLVRSRQEIWRWLLLAGLVLLIVEWGLFNRRVFT
ncbi:VWA domain-containing protein [Pirellulaceae bacterium SH449]